ncbi:amidohydrolase family protein, partial [Kineococcus sp. R8]|uniref:amidohydrolase family protein n=1 Tax=Kineococcus siccus TaxID=2696567 RepID=UPI0014125FA5
AGEFSAAACFDGDVSRGPVALRWSDGVLVVVEPGAAEAGSSEFTVLPGLVDTHVHLVGDAAGSGTDFLSWPLVTTREEQVLHGLAHAQRALAGGVTTLRDLSADERQVALRRAGDAGLVVAPRILASGVVGMTAGHADLFVPPAHPLRGPVADSPDECRRLVRTWARAGLDGIKIMTSGGVLSSGDRAGWRNHTRAEVAATIDEAHALGLLVAAHAHTEAGIAVALEEGADSIEHATGMTAAQADLLAAAGTPVAPTLLINEAIATGRVPVSAEAREKAAALVERRDALLRDAADRGVRFVLGTDANGFHVDFGDQMAEVRRMAAVFGWSPPEALRAATSRAADAIGRGAGPGALGRLVPGAAADLVVLRGRPAEDLAQLDVSRIVAVVSRGRVVAGALPGGGS